MRRIRNKRKNVAELATPSTCQLFKYRKLQITMPLTDLLGSRVVAPQRHLNEGAAGKTVRARLDARREASIRRSQWGNSEVLSGANDGNRTHDRSLGSFCFAIKLHSHILSSVAVQQWLSTCAEILRYFFLRSTTDSMVKWSKSTLSTKSRGLKRVLLNIT